MRKNQYVLKRIISLVVIIIVTIGLSVHIYKEMVASEQKVCWQTLDDTADSISDAIKVQVENNINTLRLASNAMVQEDRVESHEALVRHINAFQSMTMFHRIDMMYPDGTVLTQSGDLIDISATISFTEIMSYIGDGVYISSREEDILTKESVVWVCVPVMKDNSAVAILAGVIKCSDLPSYFGSKAYGGEATSCIVNTNDGNFIMDDWHDTLGNVYEMENRKTLPEYKDLNLKEEIRQNNTGVTAYISAKNGEPSYMYFKPTGINGWELLIVAQEKVVFSGAKALKKSLMIFGVIETLLLILYLAWGSFSTYQIFCNKDILEKQLRISNTLNKCTKELAMHSELDTSINGLLKIINDYFTGDRAYTFDIDYEESIVQNTYEYTAGNATPQIDNLQRVPLIAIQSWIEMFKEKGSFLISDVDKDVDGNTITYELLAQQDIHSLLAVPLVRNENIVGFLGVDNPKTNSSSPELLESIQFFIMDALERKEHQILLERMSIMDGLTNIYNRNKFNLFVEECEDNGYEQIGVAYFDLNGLKRANDEFGHEAGDQLIVSVANSIKSIFPKNAFRIGGDEFVVLLPNVSEDKFCKMIKLLGEKFVREDHSVSYGTAYCQNSKELTSMMKKADQKMYENKSLYYETHDRRR